METAEVLLQDVFWDVESPLFLSVECVWLNLIANNLLSFMRRFSSAPLFLLGAHQAGLSWASSLL